MLVNKKKAKEVREKGVKALKRKRRRLLPLSSKGTQSAELSKHPTTRAIGEAEERSSDTDSSSLGIAADLLGGGITFKNYLESLKGLH